MIRQLLQGMFPKTININSQIMDKIFTMVMVSLHHMAVNHILQLSLQISLHMVDSSPNFLIPQLNPHIQELNLLTQELSLLTQELSLLTLEPSLHILNKIIKLVDCMVNSNMVIIIKTKTRTLQCMRDKLEINVYF